MNQPDDFEFYKRREREERERAAAASDASVGSVHHQLADLYAERLYGDYEPRLRAVN